MDTTKLTFPDKKYVYDHPEVTSYTHFTSSRVSSTFNTVNIAESHNHYIASQTSLELSYVTMITSDNNNYAYRYYSSELGRWISRDPIAEKGGMNVYGFVGNFTLDNMDAIGLSSCCCCCPSYLKIHNLKKLLKGVMFGHEFDLTVSVIFSTPPSGIKGGNCRFKWEERTNLPYTQGRNIPGTGDYWPPNTWKDMTTSAYAKKFNDLMNNASCSDDSPTYTSIELHDTPSISFLVLLKRDMQNPYPGTGLMQGTRTLDFRFTLEGAEGCGCSPNKYIITARQKLTGRAGNNYKHPEIIDQIFKYQD